MMKNRTNLKVHVQDMGFKHKQNRRPNHAKTLKLQGNEWFDYIEHEAPR